MGKKRLQLDTYNTKYRMLHSADGNPIVDLALCWHGVSLPEVVYKGKVGDYENTHIALESMSYIFYVTPKLIKKLNFVNFGRLDIETIPSLGIHIDSYKSYAIYNNGSKTIYVWQNTVEGSTPVLLGSHCLETRETYVFDERYRQLVGDYAYLLLNLWLEYSSHIPPISSDREDWEPYGEEYTKQFKKIYFNKAGWGFTYITLKWNDSIKMRKGVPWKR